MAAIEWVHVGVFICIQRSIFFLWTPILGTTTLLMWAERKSLQSLNHPYLGGKEVCSWCRKANKAVSVVYLRLLPNLPRCTTAQILLLSLIQLPSSQKIDVWVYVSAKQVFFWFRVERMLNGFFHIKKKKKAWNTELKVVPEHKFFQK